MRRARHGRKSGGHDDESKIIEAAIEFGKPDVVTHRQRDAPTGRVECYRLGPGLDRAALVVAFVPG
jgi:hypothetical protein